MSALARREFLRMATIGCACCVAAGRLGAAEPHGAKTSAHAAPHWSYEGATGPAHWGDLRPDFKMCQLGVEQTPVDLTGGVAGDAAAVRLDYRPLPLRIVNNGHTIQVNAEPGSFCTIGGTRYDLLQFHFHHPSEHLLAGKKHDLECHFVHRSAAGALAVIGVFIRPGANNATLAPLFDAMPSREGPEIKAQGTIDPAALIPASGGYFRYMGSLTTPPCSEGLTWTVFRTPLEASPDQIRQFATLFAGNARPVQAMNRRILLESR